MIPTLSHGALYHIHRNKQRWLNEAERRRAMLLFLALFITITALVMVVTLYWKF